MKKRSAWRKGAVMSLARVIPSPIVGYQLRYSIRSTEGWA
jgi:hypothetical protein